MKFSLKYLFIIICRENDRMGPSITPYNTVGRPQGSQGYDDHTLSTGWMPAYKKGNLVSYRIWYNLSVTRTR